jgi:hypothetical protein
VLRADDIVHDDAAPVQAQIVRKAFRGSEFLYTLRLRGGHRHTCPATTTTPWASGLASAQVDHGDLCTRRMRPPDNLRQIGL